MLSVYFWSCSVDYRTCICDMQTPCHHVHFPIIFANGCTSKTGILHMAAAQIGAQMAAQKG